MGALHLVSPESYPLLGDRVDREQPVAILWIHGGHLERQTPREVPQNRLGEEELLGEQIYH